MYRWQIEALESWLAIREGVIVAPTGAGKTLVAIEAIKVLNIKPVLFVAPTNTLLSQHRKTFQGHGFVTGIWNESGKNVGRDVTFTTYNSAYMYAKELCRIHNMIVFDEVHHAFANKWMNILMEFLSQGKSVWMGLTATPENVPEKLIVYECSLEEAKSEGAISDLEVKVINLPIPANLRSTYEYIREVIAMLRQRLAWTKDEKVKLEILNRLAIWNNKLRQLLDYTVEKEMVLCEILEKERPERAIIFVESIEHADILAKALRSKGFRAFSYHSNIDRNYRESIMKAFRYSGGILVAVKALDEGIDVPSCKHIFILSVPKRLRRAIQRIGRGLRPGEVLKLYIIHTIGGEARSAIQVAKRLVSSDAPRLKSGVSLR